MFQFIRTLLLVLFLVSVTTSVYSEKSWITKKSDKTKTELKKEKKEKKEKKNKWIAKKKANKKKFQEKKKESETWITKKSKKEKKIEKKILRNYLEIADLPKADFYFSAKSDNGQIIYGYVNADKKSDLINLNGTSNLSKSNGYAYLNDGKTTCIVNSQLKSEANKLEGDLSVSCKNNLEFEGEFTLYPKVGVGDGLTNKGDIINFRLHKLKKENLAFYKTYIKDISLAQLPPTEDNEPIIDPKGKYYALLIGNSNYGVHGQWASLKSPVNDITEIGNILKKKYKFEKVISIKNANRKEIFKGFYDLSKLSTDNDYVLIYYSGHGDIVTNQSYWIPIDGEKESGYGDWINIKDIQNFIKRDSPNEILARHLVIMSDSCYFAVETKGNKLLNNKTQAYNKLLLRKARIVVASGSNEPVEDTNQDHSVFGMSFIQDLKNNEDVIRISKIIDNIIFAHSGMNQQPDVGIYPGHGGGDFLFVAKK